jgi:crossover junction endodeoxyribonuclease RuvC
VIVLGIDPGIRGGHAIVGDGNGGGTLIDAVDIPTVGDGARDRVSVLMVRDWITRHKPNLALIERAQAMPRRALEAAVALCGIPLEITEPTSWKHFWKLPPKNKEFSRPRALELFPSAHALLARKKDHGRAEAALIGLDGLRASRVIAAPPGAQPGSNMKSEQALFAHPGLSPAR